MKSKKELNALKNEVEAVSRKLHELTEDDLEQVTGGLTIGWIEANVPDLLSGVSIEIPPDPTIDG